MGNTTSTAAKATATAIVMAVWSYQANAVTLSVLSSVSPSSRTQRKPDDGTTTPVPLFDVERQGLEYATLPSAHSKIPTSFWYPIQITAGPGDWENIATILSLSSGIYSFPQTLVHPRPSSAAPSPPSISPTPIESAPMSTTPPPTVGKLGKSSTYPDALLITIPGLTTVNITSLPTEVHIGTYNFEFRTRSDQALDTKAIQIVWKTTSYRTLENGVSLRSEWPVTTFGSIEAFQKFTGFMAAPTMSAVATITAVTSTGNIRTSLTGNIAMESSPSGDCGVVGYDKGTPPAYYFSESAADVNYAACSALCKPYCISFAFGAGKCLLYSSTVAQNVNPMDGSPYTFFDVSCALNGSDTTSLLQSGSSSSIYWETVFTRATSTTFDSTVTAPYNATTSTTKTAPTTTKAKSGAGKVELAGWTVKLLWMGALLVLLLL